MCKFADNTPVVGLLSRRCPVECSCGILFFFLKIMKKVQFIRGNIDKWREAEEIVDNARAQSPDILAGVYAELTSDLAFSRSHYPGSRITIYLNNLASALHNEIYRNKREKWSRIITFWTQEIPDVMWEARRLLLASFVIFMASVLIGVVSTLGDSGFPRVILGDYYVDMTIDNIKNGTPMAVYDSHAETSMFLGITINNIKVSFLTFVSGILTSVMPAFMLLQNGVMMGAFETFFFQHGLLGEALLATMLHGTIELSSIVVAGAAGLAIGNGWLFPGTYSRIVSFRRGAKRGLKIVVGTMPLFVAAGFIESFVTRHTDIGDGIRLMIILLSALFVVGYFVVLPMRRHKSRQLKKA